MQIYELTDDQAYEMYKDKGISKIQERHLHRWLANIPLDSNFSDHLPAGHYLKVYATENRLQAEVFSITDFSIETGNNQADMFLKIWKDGNSVDYAQVRLNQKRIRYNNKLKGYWKRKTNAAGFLEVSIDNRRWFFHLTRELQNSWFKRTRRKVLYGTPLRYVITPVIFVVELPLHGYKSIKNGYVYGNISRIRNFSVNAFEKIKCMFDDLYCYDDHQDKFRGYAVTNQPKYRKKDTVRFKALNLSKKGRPRGSKPLNIYLKEGWQPYKFIDTVTPYRKGAYTYDLLLHDSLQLKLDKRYGIGIGAKAHKIVKEASFYVEDYELKSIRLELRTDGKNIHRDSTFNIHAEGKDENDLTLPDGRLNLYALTEMVTLPLQSEVFVPDTLWTHETLLKATGETIIVFPDSLLPEANISIKLIAELRNTENEYVSKTLQLEYLTEKKIKGRLEGDSLLIEYLVNGRSKPVTGVLIAGRDTLDQVNLPIRFKANPFIEDYKAIVGDSIYALPPSDFRPEVQLSTLRTSDSLVFEVRNPANIPFTWFIYRTNRLIKKGNSRQLYHIIRNPGQAKYYVNLQYVWGDQIYSDDYAVDELLRQIKLSSDLPTKGYPGMEAEFMITARDEKGRPVKDADLTAFTLTRKFGYDPPEPENFSKRTKRFRHLINRFTITDHEKDIENRLNYSYWKERLGLDSLEYYHFLYPGEDYYSHVSPTPDSTTVFAPFVVQNGRLLTSKVVYLDHWPIYFAWNTLKDPYAFEVREGYHKIKIRTDSCEVSLDSVYFQKGMKTILSIPAMANSRVHISKMTPKLSRHEKKNLHRYILPYRRIALNNGTFAYIRQGKRYFQVAPSRSYDNRTGPVHYGNANLQVLDSYELSFDHEPDFQYDFSPGVIKMRSYERYPSWLGNISAPQSLHDMPLTEETITSRKREYEEAQRLASRVYQNPRWTTGRNSSLEITHHQSVKQQRIINTLLFKLDDARFVRVYPGSAQRFHDLDSGYYKLIFFQRDRSYFSADRVRVNPGGQHFHKLPPAEIHPADSFSTTIDLIIKKAVNQKRISNSQKESINRTYRTRYSYSGVGRTYSGVVSGSDGFPLPGVTVIIKGTNYGTITDLNGYYEIYGPNHAVLNFSFVGFTREEIITDLQPEYDVIMNEDVKALSEVVVVGYGVTTKKKALSASVSTITALEGRIAGVQIVNGRLSGDMAALAGASAPIRIRGNSSMGLGNDPLIIVNGQIFEGDLDESLIDKIEILSGNAATTLYGSRASGGVLIISTKEGYKDPASKKQEELLESLPQQNSIRTNFQDHALWEPQLRTDGQGKARIRLKLPDDITNWETHILAYGRGRRTGRLKVSTQSYLPISGRLALPRFLIPGDSVIVLGKVSNYTGLPQKVSSTFLWNDEVKKRNEHMVENAMADSLWIYPVHSNDTLNITYTITSENGFTDGEQRDIPVYERGITTAKGYFWSLDSDTTFTVSFPDSLGTVQLHATASLDNIFLDEINYLINYRYECNEQLASKLMAIGIFNRIKGTSGDDIRYRARAERIMKKLRDRQSSEGYWGWWSEDRFEPWVTEHILKAAWLTEDMVKNTLRFDHLIEHALWELNKPLHPDKKLRLISIVNRLDSAFDVKPYLTDIKTHWEELSTLNKFRVWRLEQVAGLTVPKDSVMAYAQFDSYGNLSFESPMKKERTAFYRSDIYLTLKGYELLYHMGDRKLTRKIINYLLKRRSNGRWRNTYESAQVIYTLKDEIGGINDEPTKLELSGSTERSIVNFPFDQTVTAGKLTVKKTGNAPVYLTAWQEMKLTDPEVYDEHFKVETSFDKGKNNTLEAGEVIEMKVKLTAHKEAEYLVLDVPIPAGCSYVDKRKDYREVHREYYREKVSIFFKSLRRGEHDLSIRLIPRFEGYFTQNPAQAHWMYFPTISGWNESRRVKVSGE